MAQKKQSFTVSGNVCDTDDNPLRGVRVFLRMQDRIETSDPTDTDGRYEFTMDRPGECDIFFVREHYDLAEGTRYNLLTEWKRGEELEAGTAEYYVPTAYYVQVSRGPILEVSDRSLTMTLKSGGTATSKLIIKNGGDAQLSFALEEDPGADWLEEDLKEGTLDPGVACEVLVTFDATDLEPGFYNTNLVITTEAPPVQQIDVPVTLSVEQKEPVDLKVVVEELLAGVTQLKGALDRALAVPYLDTDTNFQTQIGAQVAIVGNLAQFLDRQWRRPNIAELKREVGRLVHVEARVQSFIKLAAARLDKPPAASKVDYLRLKAEVNNSLSVLKALERWLDMLNQLG